MPGSPDWGGSAPLSQSITAIQAASVSIPAGGQQTFTGMISRTGYEIMVQLVNSTTGSVKTPVKIFVTWLDTTSGIVVEKQLWWVSSGDATGAHVILGRGPSAGNQVKVQVTNFSGAAPSLLASVTLLDVARTYVGHKWETDVTTGPVFPGFTAAASDLPAGIIAAAAAQPIAAAGSVAFLLPLAPGPFVLVGFTTSGTTDGEYSIEAALDTLVGGIAHPLDQLTDAKGDIFAQSSLPREQMTITLHNHSAGSQSMSYYLMAAPPLV